jgi:hypothetical protein
LSNRPTDREERLQRQLEALEQERDEPPASLPRYLEID